MQNHLRRDQSLILACSALKAIYRDLLGVDQACIVTVYLKGSPELLSRRVMMREHPYMKTDLLQSQLDTLEEPEGGLWVDIERPPPEIVQSIVESLELAS
jgi:gluconokinase